MRTVAGKSVGIIPFEHRSCYRSFIEVLRCFEISKFKTSIFWKNRSWTSRMGDADHLSGGMHTQWKCANIPPDTLVLLQLRDVTFGSPFVANAYSSMKHNNEYRIRWHNMYTVTITQSMPSDEVACHETKFNNNLWVFQGDNARLTFSNTVFSDSARWNARAFLLRVESTEQ